MGRPPIGEVAMTGAERVARYRVKHAAAAAERARAQKAKQKEKEAQFNRQHERAGAEILALTILDAAEALARVDPKHITPRVRKMIHEAAHAWAAIAAKVPPTGGR